MKEKTKEKTYVFDYSAFPTLITQRLTLRQLERADAQDVLVFRGDFEVQKYNGPVLKTIKETQTLIEDIRAEYDEEAGIVWAVTLTASDTVVGLFGYHNWNRYHRRAELGFDLARAHWRQGIGTEAVHALVRFGFAEMDLHRIYANTIADNHGSVALLEKVGFIREGTRREHSWEEDGAFHDSAIYGLLRREYAP